MPSIPSDAKVLEGGFGGVRRASRPRIYLGRGRGSWLRRFLIRVAGGGGGDRFPAAATAKRSDPFDSGISEARSRNLSLSLETRGNARRREREERAKRERAETTPFPCNSAT